MGSRYKTHLQELARKHQLDIRQLNDIGPRTAAQAGTRHAAAFKFRPPAPWRRLTGFLNEFYSQNLPHQIKEISVTSLGAGQEGRLDIQLRVEALSMPNATNRDFLIAVPDWLVALDTIMAIKQGPIGLGLTPWLISPPGPHGAQKLASLVHTERDYTKLPSKNIFAGFVPPSVAGSADEEDPQVRPAYQHHVELPGHGGFAPQSPDEQEYPRPARRAASIRLRSMTLTNVSC